MAKTLSRTIRNEPLSPAKILREVLRHYTEFRQYVADGEGDLLEYTYTYKGEDGKLYKETVAFSFWDLHRGIKELAPRKREALFWNIICDEKQKDVAKRMGITTVSVGQYCQAACEQLIEHHFKIEREDDANDTGT